MWYRLQKKNSGVIRRTPLFEVTTMKMLGLHLIDEHLLFNIYLNNFFGTLRL